MPIPTELVGSLPRPMKLQKAFQAHDDGQIDFEQLQAEQDKAAEDSIKRLEETGETYVTDGEQRESSFATYPITDTLAGTGLADNLAGDGQFFAIFDDGHHRQLPRLTGGPFRYKTYASEFVEKNKQIASSPVKQAVISASMMMLLGWGVLAVPTGIVSAEMVRHGRAAASGSGAGRGLLGDATVQSDTAACADCGADAHAADARFCRCCGSVLS